MNTNKLTFHNALLIGSLIFGMLFGAGNLIFPVHLGQMAGAHWLSAAGGFLMSGVLLPLMALLAERGLAPVLICESAGTQAGDARAMQAMYRTACKT